MGIAMTGNDEMTFEAWVAHVFDHEVCEPAWYWDIDAEEIELSPEQTVRYFTALFRTAWTILKPFSDAQVNQGLWYITSSASSDCPFDIADLSVPWEKREACIQSIYTLYAECFAKRCEAALSHTDESTHPLNSICYMLWDIFPIGVNGEKKRPEAKQHNRKILNTMIRMLDIDHIACQEAALHGLGHWQYKYPDEVKRATSKFLQKPNLPAALRQYCIRASTGYVQ